MSGAIRDQVKQIAREVISSQTGSAGKYRLATVNSQNDDGTVTVMVDGNAVTAHPIYPLVVGQQVAVIYGDTGDVSAVPTRPKADDVPTIHPPFFSGGFMRFLGVNALLQDAGISKTFQILAPDLVGYLPKGGCLSPDGTRCCIVWFNANGFGGSQATPDVHYRVYKLGQNLQGTSTSDPTKFISTAPLLFEVIRTLYNRTFSSLPPLPFSNALTNIFYAGAELDVVCALDSNENRLYWVEVQIQVASTYTGGSDSGSPPPLLPDGTPMQITNLFQYDNSTTTTLIIGTWYTWITNNFIFPFQGDAITSFSKGISFPRAVFSLDCVDGVPYAASLAEDLAGMTPAIVDPSISEMVGIVSDPLGSGCVASILPIDNEAGLGIHGTPPNTFTKLVFAAPDGPEGLASWDTGCQYLYLDFLGVHTLELVFPACSGANGPKINLEGDVTYSRSDGGGLETLSSGQISRLKNFISYIYNGLNTGGTAKNPLDFISVLYKNTKGQYFTARFTNSIAHDPFFNHGISSILPARGTLFMMKSVSKGWFVDQSLHVRNVSSSDGGQTFTMDTDITKFVQVSPNQSDPTILLVFPLSAVSTL